MIVSRLLRAKKSVKNWIIVLLGLGDGFCLLFAHKPISEILIYSSSVFIYYVYIIYSCDAYNRRMHAELNGASFA